MIAIDTNILVYAHRRDSEWHEKASPVVAEIAEGAASWGIAWPCLHEFLAVVTHPRIYKPPTPLSKAIEQVEIWMESPSLHLLQELHGHWQALKGILTSGRIAGGAVHDARIAAIYQENGVREIWSADRDFGRIAGIVIRNPLIH